MSDISEEVKNAAVAAPVAIIVGGKLKNFRFLSILHSASSDNHNPVATTAFLGFFLVISLCYGIRDLSALPGPTGLVFAQVKGVYIQIIVGKS